MYHVTPQKQTLQATSSYQHNYNSVVRRRYPVLCTPPLIPQPPNLAFSIIPLLIHSQFFFLIVLTIFTRPVAFGVIWKMNQSNRAVRCTNVMVTRLTYPRHRCQGSGRESMNRKFLHHDGRFHWTKDFDVVVQSHKDRRDRFIQMQTPDRGTRSRQQSKDTDGQEKIKHGKRRESKINPTSLSKDNAPHKKNNQNDEKHNHTGSPVERTDLEVPVLIFTEWINAPCASSLLSNKHVSWSIKIPELWRTTKSSVIVPLCKTWERHSNVPATTLF